MEDKFTARKNSKKTFKNNSILTSIDTMGRQVPSALDLEEAVLGALILDGDSMLRVQEILKPDYFFAEKHKYIYDAIRDLIEKNEPVDLLTVIEKLRSQEKLELVGGEFYVSELTMKVSSSANIEYHVHIILEKYVQRELIRICGETIRDAYEASTDAFQLLDDTEKTIYEIKNQGMKRNYVSIDNLVEKALKQIEANNNNTSEITGVPSGIASVDRITSGWQNSDLIILAGRPGMGKTAFALTMLRNASIQHNIPVAFFSLEMSAVQLVTRLISSESEISSEDLRKGKLETYQWEQVVHKTRALAEAPVYIDDTPSLSVFELKAKARRLHSQHKIGLIIVDYLQLMKGDDTKEAKMNREQEVSYISRSLKTLAKELDIPVIALAQLSRETEKRQDKTPQLSDLRESGSIEQDADLVAFIYRDDYYGSPNQEDGGAENAAKLIIKKHRNGSPGDAEMYFESRIQRFIDLDEANLGGTFTMPSKLNEGMGVESDFQSKISGKDNIFGDSGSFDNPFDNSDSDDFPFNDSGDTGASFNDN